MNSWTRGSTPFRNCRRWPEPRRCPATDKQPSRLLHHTPPLLSRRLPTIRSWCPGTSIALLDDLNRQNAPSGLGGRGLGWLRGRRAHAAQWTLRNVGEEVESGALRQVAVAFFVRDVSLRGAFRFAHDQTSGDGAGVCGRWRHASMHASAHVTHFEPRIGSARLPHRPQRPAALRLRYAARLRVLCFSAQGLQSFRPRRASFGQREQNIIPPWGAGPSGLPAPVLRLYLRRAW